MTTQQWLVQARQDRDALLDLLAGYHPSVFTRRQALPITAPNAEAACAQVRQAIRREAPAVPPGRRFDEALDRNDADTAWTLLNEAWFGVPESTDCWSVRGFSEAVALLEDPPDDVEGVG